MSNFDHFVGTGAVSEKHAFDIAALSAWLTKNLSGFEGPLTVEMFKGGQSNPTYKLVTPAKNYVMRAKPGPVAKLLPSAHAVEREFAVMQGLAGTDVPVPTMYCLCEDESIIGRAFYVMEFMQGRVIWDQSLPGMDRAQRGAIYDEMNRVISALHTVKFAERGLAGYGKPGNYFERQIGRWSKQYTASITQPIPEMDQLMEWLPKNIPSMARDESMVSIVHGDYRLDNLMFDQQQPKVIAVLDWELSTLGHPLADFSYHCMAWHIPPGAFRGIGGPAWFSTCTTSPLAAPPHNVRFQTGLRDLHAIPPHHAARGQPAALHRFLHPGAGHASAAHLRKPRVQVQPRLSRL